MRFLVISDTHGDIDPAIEVYGTLDNINRIVHLGDYARDAWQLEDRLGVSVTAVLGNMDGSYSNEAYKILNTEFGKIYLSHGHMESVKHGVEKLLYKASSLGCKAAMFGHTHVPMYKDISGMHLLNPGSLTYPRGNRQGSYALVTTSAESLQAEILYWNPVKQKAKQKECGAKKNISSGFLRKIFNDSDGQ